MNRIRKTRDGWRVIGGTFTYYQMIELATNMLRAVNGKTAFKEEIPQSYSASAALTRIKKQSPAKREDL